jgi:hypothetical protein
MLIKINIEDNNSDGKDINSKEDKTLFASWLISLTSEWGAK